MNPERFRTLLAVSLLALATAYSAFGQERQRPVKIGVLAEQGMEKCLEQWGPTAEYLAEQIPGYSFVIVPLDYDEVHPSVERGDVDFVLANPSFYVEIEARYGANRLATLVNLGLRTGWCGQTRYTGAIFHRADRSDIEHLADLKGKTFMAVEKRSFGGWRMAWRELKEVGIDPDPDFSELRFGGTHDAVVYAVRDGKVDAGTVRTDTLERMEREGKIRLEDFRVIHEHGEHFKPGPLEEAPPRLHSTRSYPKWPFAKVKHTPHELAQKVAVALLGMPADSPAARAAGCAGWTVPLNYHSVHECLKALHVAPYEDFGKVTLRDVLRGYRPYLLLVIAFLVAMLVTTIWVLRLNRAQTRLQGELENELSERKQTERALRDSEERFRLAAQSTSDLIYEWDIATDRLDWFGDIDATLGLEFSELPRTVAAWAERIHPNDQERLHGSVQRHRVSTEPIHEEYCIQRKDGTWRDWIDRGAPVLDNEGRPRKWVGACIDVTKRKRAEEALRESEVRFRELFDNMSSGVAVFEAVDDGKDFVFVDFNRAGERIERVTKEEVVGKLVTEIFPSVEKIGLLDVFRQVWRAGEPKHHPVSFYDDDRIVGWRENFVYRLPTGEVVAVYNDITERKQAEEERTRLVTAIEQAAEAVVITDAEGTIQYVSPAFQRITGYSPEEAVGQNPRMLKSGRQGDTFYRELWDTLVRGDVWTGYFINKKRDGTFYEEEATISPVRDDAGKIINYVAVKRDVTQEVTLEAQLRQSQKMEAIGQLAGGLAHDFNNMLTVILGNVDLMQAPLKRSRPADDPLLENLVQIEQSARHAASLTRQLLAFGRRQVIQPEVLDPNLILADMEEMLRRLIREDIELDIIRAPEVWCIRADSGQLEQVVMNLLVNARDAMPDGGKLIVETANVTLDDAYVAERTEARVGPHVMLAVSDTGKGMDKATLERVFEPFFTTKALGEGTGLGLATVHGIVKQTGGHILVDSEVNQGTTFKVYLPAVREEAPCQADDLQRDESAAEGEETILVCEDEPIVRQLTCEALESRGYTVLSAEGPKRALELAGDHSGPIHLMITDVIMPGMNGKELAEALVQTRTGMRVLYVSGYPSNVISHHGVVDEGVEFLEKPFALDVLWRRVRDLLDRSDG